MPCQEIEEATIEAIKRKNDKTDECLDLVHIDEVEPMNVKAYCREEFFVSFVDD